MSERRSPDRSDYKRLEADHVRLRKEVEALRERLQRQEQELKVQFTRLAEIQAILDEERRAK